MVRQTRALVSSVVFPFSLLFSLFKLSPTLPSTLIQGDEIHLLHVIPLPMPEVVAGGFGAMDSVITVDPDPKEDLKHIADAKNMMRTLFTPTLASKVGIEIRAHSHSLSRTRSRSLSRTRASARSSQDVPYQVEIIHYLTDSQSIGEAICTRAENLNAAVVAMAKHSRGKVSTFVFGSSSRYVTEHASCPVIIVENNK